MSWRVSYASVAGTSHAVTGEPCQDSCFADVVLTEEGVETLFVFVADGAGSAKRGGAGAEAAIEAATRFVDEALRKPQFFVTDVLARACVAAVRTRIDELAASESLSPRDFACTFLGVLTCSFGTLALQLGDGGIVLDFGNGLVVPTIPMNGEYANMTHFVTDEDAMDRLQAIVFPEGACKVAVFSDGLQRLALNMADNSAFEPFFKSKFEILARSASTQEDEVQRALHGFLDSEAVNQRTDDDKTLALAVRLD